MKIFIGTSGWLYSWNLDRTLDWYVQNTKLNAIELNMSFYRFPFPSQVKSWRNKGKDLRWSIKVNRLITHIFKLGERSYTTWKKFFKLFKPLDSLIDFYLFQLPPSLSWKAKEQVEKFFKKSKLNERFALEVRHESWFNETAYSWAKQLGLTWVSVDCPDFPRDIVKIAGRVYLRMHGRSAWYSHKYSQRELREVVYKIKAAKPKQVYVFFNNDHDMKDNAEAMLKMFKLVK